MPQATKRRVLVLLFASLAAVLLLAASLSNLQLHAGTPFPGGEAVDEGMREFLSLPPGESHASRLLQGLFALVFLALLVYLAARLAALANISKIAGLVGLLALLFVLVSLLPRVMPVPPSVPIEEVPQVEVSPAAEYPVAPLGEPPEALIWLVIIGFIGGAGLLGLISLRQKPTAKELKDPLGQEAMKAVDALHAGKGFGNVIIQCYMQMARVLQEEQGMERQGQITVREFETLLEARGIPHSPVHQLTGLFEKVRYGGQPTSEDDQRLGIECLNEITGFCRREKG